MTEDKRYELIWETDELCNVFDDEISSILSVEEVVDLLNNYSDENKQLKEEKEQIKSKAKEFLVYYQKKVGRQLCRHQPKEGLLIAELRIVKNILNEIGIFDW